VVRQELLDAALLLRAIVRLCQCPNIVE
jgi:hypothetical protein